MKQTAFLRHFLTQERVLADKTLNKEKQVASLTHIQVALMVHRCLQDKAPQYLSNYYCVPLF